MIEKITFRVKLRQNFCQSRKSRIKIQPTLWNIVFTTIYNFYWFALDNQHLVKDKKVKESVIKQYSQNVTKSNDYSFTFGFRTIFVEHLIFCLIGLQPIRRLTSVQDIFLKFKKPGSFKLLKLRNRGIAGWSSLIRDLVEFILQETKLLPPRYLSTPTFLNIKLQASLSIISTLGF